MAVKELITDGGVVEKRNHVSITVVVLCMAMSAFLIILGILAVVTYLA